MKTGPRSSNFQAARLNLIDPIQKLCRHMPRGRTQILPGTAAENDFAYHCRHNVHLLGVRDKGRPRLDTLDAYSVHRRGVQS